MKYKVIITGSTGMVGKGVLLACLESDAILEVLVINRSAIDISNPKLKEVLLKDFTKTDSIKEQLKGYDACFHCMGVSSSGLNEANYTILTFEVTKSLVDTLLEINPKMTFNYVSGTGTDTSEKGRSMWARVKGKTENYILNKGFGASYMFRPGFIVPEKGIKSKTKLYRFFYAILKPFFGLIVKSKNVTTTTKLGIAMIASLNKKYEKTYLENQEINALAEMNS
ncbi:NAD-dependent epimerase/dehydratase family protein [Lacihabitans sp. LS3-19]|uniref:NAD-dependent epimerase/dehydratase family protein n=1 Tax=Lacihabitans sp. LS3-19 TaxID=2487335 RepID=UPI0020CC105E|nr:NAD-dependent epimerase/dehydratase family protein [Lacihabitans sp. LS3-19]MCP9768479.1 NAD-dependent epimerase/dehydratase family protein [Lacihabitans sp. LS3-19]